MQRIITTVFAMLATAFLLGCSGQSGVLPPPEQMCRIASLDDKIDCERGDLIVFAPNFFGNKQLPVIASSRLCDFRYSIVQTDGGVACVLWDRRSQ